MNIVNYVRGLKNNFSLKRVHENLDSTRDQLINQTIPVIESLAKEFNRTGGSASKKSETYRNYDESIRKGVTYGVRGGNLFDLILVPLNNAVDTLNWLGGYIDKSFENDVTAVSLDLARANALQLLDGISLVTRYSRRLADIVLIAETRVMSDAEASELDSVTPLTLSYLAENRLAYIHMLNILGRPATDYEKLFAEMPEVTVSEIKNQNALSLHGKDKVDPLRFGFIESRFNPIWLVITNLADYHNKCYQEAKEDRRLLELRIERYKRNYQNNPNPKLGKIIEGYEADLDLVRAKIAKMEK